MAGIRNTVQRQSILEAVCATDTHPTAEEIYARLKQHHPKLSLGTVYRNLHMLSDSGEILRISLVGASDRFDRTTAPHMHLLCKTCGRVVDVPDGGLMEKARELLPPMAHQVDDIHFFLTGICETCKRKQE